jgi:hypothetical protein
MQAFIGGLMLPLMLLNVFGGIVSGVWLAILGQWWAIGIGLAAIFAHMFLSPVMLVGMVFGAPAVALINRGQTVLALPFILLSQLWTYGIVAIWCIASFHYFMSHADHRTYIPLLIWSYGVAVGPWANLSQREMRAGGGEAGLMATFFVQIAYVVTGIALIFVTAYPMTLLIIFLSILGIGMLAQTGLAYAMMAAQRAG